MYRGKVWWSTALNSGDDYKPHAYTPPPIRRGRDHLRTVDKCQDFIIQSIKDLVNSDESLGYGDVTNLERGYNLHGASNLERDVVGLPIVKNDSLVKRFVICLHPVRRRGPLVELDKCHNDELRQSTP